MNFNELMHSKTFTAVVLSILGVVVLLLDFQAGMLVGEHRAEFSYRWGEEYHRNFGGPGGGFMAGVPDTGMANPHATFGKIIRINLPTVTVISGDVEKVVTLTDDTIIRRLSGNAMPTDLHVGDQVVVLGEPNSQAQIEASLIRVMPAMMSPTITPTSSH